jgi:non-ribosomal peptide synthetase-like protein
MTAFASTRPAVLLGPDRPELVRDETLGDLFRASAARFGGKTALVFGSAQLSYEELDGWSNAIAHQLHAAGVQGGDFVGVWWPRGLELHALLLGIMKSGAAYVPLDREMPAERVANVLAEVGARVCFADADFGLPITRLAPVSPPTTPLPAPSSTADARSIAYVLYTSGSTGRPKGIPITHGQICHLVRAENEVIGICADDRVYQGFSVSFDMWCEETLVSYLAGATLFVADATTARAVDELGETLRAHQVTVLHAVPSLLAVMDDTVPSLRLVNAGGEACPPAVVARWATPGRTFYNSYGPTETTVTATMVVLKPGDPISIGRPLPNYNLAVVSVDGLEPVPFGERGELIITGPGVGVGYIDRPELTAEKFQMKPATLDYLPGDRLYRSGDEVAILEDGTVQFFGRLDDQIKLRGYRIELGEIENRLAALPGVHTAAVALKKDNLGQEHLVAFVVQAREQALQPDGWRPALAAVLPPYMVPEMLTVLPAMPRLPSGKVDRKALPVPDELHHLAQPDSMGTLAPDAPVADRVRAALGAVFPGRAIDLDQDFFDDLGGHSLLAAGFVSHLRNEGGLLHASLRDVYLHRPLRALVSAWEAGQAPSDADTRTAYRAPSRASHFLCWIGQTFVLLVVYGLFAVEVFSPFLSYYYVHIDTGSNLQALLTSIVAYLLMPPTILAVVLLTKWLVIGRFRAGDYPLWGSYYFRWWTVKTVQRLVPEQFMTGTPIYPRYLRLLGARVAHDAQLSNLTFGASDLIDIGPGVSTSTAVVLDNAVVEGGMLRIRPIRIDAFGYLGTSAVVGGGTHIEAWGELGDLSYLPPDSTIRAREYWAGSPAARVKERSESEMVAPFIVPEGRQRRFRRVWALTLLLFPLVVLLPLLPIIITLARLDEASPDFDFTYLVIVPVMSAIYLVLLTLETVVLSRWLMRGVRPGSYSVYSGPYWRKWLADTLFNVALVGLHPLFATVYVGRFYRWLGARIGRGTEISTASNVTHTMLDIGEGSFIADAVTLGESEVRGHRFVLESTSVGSNTFVGNSANVPQGAHLPGGILVGVLSQAPDATALAAHPGHDWFGSPAIALPRRQESQAFDPSLTYRPSKRRWWARATIEAVRILLPQSAILAFSVLFISFGVDLVTDNPWYIVAPLVPVYYLAFIGIPAFVLTVVLKWVTVGRSRREELPIYAFRVWRAEAVTTTYEALAVPYLLDFLRGTPWLPVLLRLLGTRIGKRVYLATTDITEPDLVSIGDDAMLNEDCGPQTHLFEDRVMKTGSVRIGARTSIGARSIVLYHTDVGDDATIDPLSLVMKGEVLAAGTRWAGSPVRPR